MASSASSRWASAGWRLLALLIAAAIGLAIAVAGLIGGSIARLIG